MNIQRDSNQLGGTVRAPRTSGILPLSTVHRAAASFDRKAYDAVYHAKNRERIRARKSSYRETHREEASARNAAYYAAHREEICTRNRANYAACPDPDERRILKAKYRRSHGAERRASAMARKAKMLGVGTRPDAGVSEVYRRARGDAPVRCYLCGGVIPIGQRHVDHVMPLSKGGLHQSRNLAIACGRCNLSKGSKHPNEVGVLI